MSAGCTPSRWTSDLLDLFPSREASPFGRRLKRERGARIPVTVVTGFLGAGKTTLIRRFLRSPEGRGTAVIVNEFGAVGIDDALVRDSAEETVLLGNGCLCCITRTDLQAALRRLVFDRERGTRAAVRPRADRDVGACRSGPDSADLLHRSRARRRVSHRCRAGGGRCGERRDGARRCRRSAQAGHSRRSADYLEDRSCRRSRRDAADAAPAIPQSARRDRCCSIRGARSEPNDRAGRRASGRVSSPKPSTATA